MAFRAGFDPEADLAPRCLVPYTNMHPQYLLEIVELCYSFF